MILNTFDEYKAALKKCHLNESVMPLKRGYLVENVDLYNKVQKMLNCPDMEDCHPYLYGIDVDNLNESDEEKIEQLYQLGVKRNFITDDPEDAEGDAYADQMVDGETPDQAGAETAAATGDDALAQADGYAKQATATRVQPTTQQTFQKAQPVARDSAFTVLYSAMKDGEITTGEYYSNSFNTRSAKSDAIANLSKLGFDNIKILAIQAGDPDLAGCNEEGCECADVDQTSDSVNESEGDEDDKGEELTEAEEADAKKDAKEAFDKAKKDSSQEEPSEVKKFLSSKKAELKKVKDSLKSPEAKKAFDKIIDFLGKYGDENKDLNDKLDAYLSRADEASGKKKNPICTLVRGLVRVLLGCFYLIGKVIGGTGAVANYLLNIIETIICSSAKKLDGYLPEEEAGVDGNGEEQVNESGEAVVTFDMLQRGLGMFRNDVVPSIIAGVGSAEEASENYIDGAGFKNMVCKPGPTVDSVLIIIEVGDGNTGKLWSAEEIQAFLNTCRRRGRGKKLVLQVGYEDGTDFNGAEVTPHEVLELDPDPASGIVNIVLAPAFDESVNEASDEEEAGVDGNGKEQAADADGSEEDETDSSLTPEKKAELKAAYTKAFKRALSQLKYTKCVDDLSVAEKAEFWRMLGTTWMQEAPSQFLTAKEQAALQKVVIKK